MKLDLQLEELEAVEVPMSIWAAVAVVAGAGAVGMLAGAGIAVLLT